MESLSFKHAPIRVGSDLNNLSFLVATNGNCSTTNTLTEVKGIGYYNSYPLQSPNGYITNNISFQYLIQNSDPIRSILELHKSGQFENATPYYVDIGGLTFRECYLESFSLSINPSTVASAQVNFVSYSPASGQFGKYQLPANTNIDADFLHGTETNVSISETTLIPFQIGIDVYPNNRYTFKSATTNLLGTVFNPSLFNAPYQDILNIFPPNEGQQSFYFDGSEWIYSDFSPNANNYVIPNNSIIEITTDNITSVPIGGGAIIQKYFSEYFGLNYNLKLQHQPINTIGSSYPKTIKFHGAVEELELTENLYKRILYTGDTKSITINSSAICCPDIDYSISINNAQSISASASTQNNGVVTTLRKFTKYY
jgi:hypothetical protein